MSPWLEVVVFITCLVVIRHLAPDFIRDLWKTLLILVGLAVVALAVLAGFVFLGVDGMKQLFRAVFNIGGAVFLVGGSVYVGFWGDDSLFAKWQHWRKERWRRERRFRYGPPANEAPPQTDETCRPVEVEGRG